MVSLAVKQEVERFARVALSAPCARAERETADAPAAVKQTKNSNIATMMGVSPGAAFVSRSLANTSASPASSPASPPLSSPSGFSPRSGTPTVNKPSSCVELREARRRAAETELVADGISPSLGQAAAHCSTKKLGVRARLLSTRHGFLRRTPCVRFSKFRESSSSFIRVRSIGEHFRHRERARASRRMNLRSCFPFLQGSSAARAASCASFHRLAASRILSACPPAASSSGKTKS